MTFWDSTSIVFYPDRRLREISSNVTVFDDLLKFIVDRMIEQMYDKGGIGLAAPQIGINRNIILVDASAGHDAKQLITMINPKIVCAAGKAVSEESCLSIPNVKAKIERAASVSVRYQNLLREELTLQAIGLQSIIIQHEIDHLNGILFIDHIKPETRKLVNRLG